MSTMFCSQCGEKNSSDSKFCSQCGKNICAAENTARKSDLNKILKQDDFNLDDGSFWGSFFSKGLFGKRVTLTLYPDRITCKGSAGFVINISEIINVSIKDSYGSGTLMISTSDGKLYGFVKVNKQTVYLSAISGDYLLGAMTDKKISDLEYWRMTIEKLRGN